MWMGFGLQQNVSEEWQDLQLGLGSLTVGEKGWDGCGVGSQEGNGTAVGSAGGDEGALG